MRVATYPVFDAFVYANDLAFSPARLNERLGEHDLLAFQLVVDWVSGTSPTLAAAVQTSADGQRWILKANPLYPTPLTEGETNVLTLADVGTQPSLGLVRLFIFLGGTSTKARVRAHVTMRNTKRREVTPLTILGGGYWWTAQRGVDPGLDGQPVDGITGQGQNRLFLSQTGSNRPTFDADAGNGLPALVHASQYLAEPTVVTIGSGDFAMGCVFKAAAGVTGGAFGISDVTTTDFAWIGKFDTAVRMQWNTSTGTSQLDFSTGADWHTCVLRRVSGTMYASIDGGAESSSSTNAGGTINSSALQVALGGIPTPSIILPLTGETREAFLYNGTVDAAKIAELHTNMAARWEL